MIYAPTAHTSLVTSGLEPSRFPTLSRRSLRTTPFTEQTKTSSHKGMTPHAEFEDPIVQVCLKHNATPLDSLNSADAHDTK